MAGVLRVLQGGQSSGENNSKLLELADRDGADTPHAPTNGGEPMEEEDPEGPSEAAVSSVITQVVVRQDQSAAVAGARLAGVDDQDVRSTWKNKLR